MLSTDQIAHLDEAERELNDRTMMLNTAIDVQSILRLFVDKGIITKEEVQQYREEVRKSPKYNLALQYLEETKAEIIKYKNDPQAQLQEMFKRKMEGK